MTSGNRELSGKTVLATTLLLFFGTLLGAHAQTLSTLKIGDDVSRLSSIGNTPSATDTYKSSLVRKWTLSNGNELSVTTSQSGRIVYLESDWNGGGNGPICDLPGLKFGVTTLADLRKRFGSNGFGFQSRGAVIKIPDGVVMMNSYEVGTTIVTFITKVTDKDYLSMKQSGQSLDTSSLAKLDAISIAEAEYAKSEWGDRVYDPDYKKIDWK